MRRSAEHGGGPLEDGPHVEVGALELELPGLDLGQVEDVVDDRRAGSARRSAVPRPAGAGASSRSVRISSSLSPMTPFIGVRISWLMVARNSDFSRDASIASSRASASCLAPALTLGHLAELGGDLVDQASGSSRQAAPRRRAPPPRRRPRRRAAPGWPPGCGCLASWGRRRARSRRQPGRARRASTVRRRRSLQRNARAGGCGRGLPGRRRGSTRGRRPAGVARQRRRPRARRPPSGWWPGWPPRHRLQQLEAAGGLGGQLVGGLTRSVTSWAVPPIRERHPVGSALDPPRPRTQRDLAVGAHDAALEGELVGAARRSTRRAACTTVAVVGVHEARNAVVRRCELLRLQVVDPVQLVGPGHGVGRRRPTPSCRCGRSAGPWPAAARGPAAARSSSLRSVYSRDPVQPAHRRAVVVVHRVPADERPGRRAVGAHQEGLDVLVRRCGPRPCRRGAVEVGRGRPRRARRTPRTRASRRGRGRAAAAIRSLA